MSDLIRRSDAIDTIRNQCVIGKMWGGEEAESTLIDAYDTIDEVSDIPAVDAVEVVHGEWIGDNRFVGWPNWNCSVCHGEGRGDYRICPWCGARMDGRREDGDDGT